jgi:hypothetical protein
VRRLPAALELSPMAARVAAVQRHIR